MNINVPYRVRVAIYLITSVGTPVVAYLLSRGIIGNLEVTLWSAEVGAAGILAALNVKPEGPTLQ